jgi:hypothetical protein
VGFGAVGAGGGGFFIRCGFGGHIGSGMRVAGGGLGGGGVWRGSGWRDGDCVDTKRSDWD